MTKVLAILLVLAATAGIYWTVSVRGADGSWLAIVAPVGMLAIMLGITKKHTGKWLTDESGGH